MKTNREAFTRLELLFVLLAVATIALPAISLLASNKTDTQRVVCFTNLRQIGHGSQAWASDHGDRFPWAVPANDGGGLSHPLSGNVWFEFALMSNYLHSPKLLVCPANLQTPQIADNWSSQPGGLLNVQYRNNALSYFIALHSQPYSGQSILLGDWNIQASSVSVCSLLPNGVTCPQLTPGDSVVKWTNAIHGVAGHLLFADGSVRFSDTSDLQKAVRNDGDDDNGSGVHILSKVKGRI